MKHLVALRDQIIGDDAPVAAPPARFGAHDRTDMRAVESVEFHHPLAEIRRGCIVGIIAKTGVLPERVSRRRAVPHMSTKAAQPFQVAVADLEGRQNVGKAVAIELGIGARARNAPDIDDEISSGVPQQRDEFFDRARGMTYREKCRV